MREWHRILTKVLVTGVKRPDRTGAGTLAVFGEQLRLDNRKHCFPAVTTKQLAFKPMAAELACFIRGHDNLEDFQKAGCGIWDGNGNADYWRPRQRRPGDLGRIYGVQWRDWLSVTAAPTGHSGTRVRHTDQLANMIDGLKQEPYGRRHIVTSLNPGEFDQMCLPPCHVLFQCFAYEDSDGRPMLDLRVDMRSVDLFLGLPFDIASYAILQRLIAREVGRENGFLTFQLGDAHIYLNHLEQVRLVLQRLPHASPLLVVRDSANLFDFQPDDVWLEGYAHDGPVAAPLNV